MTNKNIKLTKEQELLLIEFVNLYIRYYSSNMKPNFLQNRLIEVLEEYDFLIDYSNKGDEKK